jgi:hypothetical protein
MLSFLFIVSLQIAAKRLCYTPVLGSLSGINIFAMCGMLNSAKSTRLSLLQAILCPLFQFVA